MRFLKSAVLLLALMLLIACPGPIPAAAADDVLTVEDPEISVLRARLEDDPAPQHIRLTGTLPPMDALIRLKNEFPGTVLEWEFDMFGIPVSTLSEHIDISGIPVTDVQAVEALLPAFYSLKSLGMCGCGIADEEMDALRSRHPETKIVWAVKVGPMTVRTDSTVFMPIREGYNSLPPNATRSLKYCTELQFIDLGHFPITDVTFTMYMPQLRYLILGGGQFTDLTPIGHCTSLVYLELFLTKSTDLWPLTNCTGLRDLNISYMPYGDPTPLLQMTWLDRLWLANSRLSSGEKAMLRNALPDTVMLFNSASSTNHGWRSSPNYFRMRDLVGGRYMTK